MQIVRLQHPASSIINVCMVYSIRWREKFSQLKNNLARIKKKTTDRDVDKQTGTCLTKFFFRSTRKQCLVYARHVPVVFGILNSARHQDNDVESEDGVQDINRQSSAQQSDEKNPLSAWSHGV